MMNDELPDNTAAMAALCRAIAPDAVVDVLQEWSAGSPPRAMLYVADIEVEFKGRCLYLAGDERGWFCMGIQRRIQREWELVKRLCKVFDVPFLGPNDLRLLELHRGVQHEVPEEICRRALGSHSEAVLACARALPNNRWANHRG